MLEALFKLVNLMATGIGWCAILCGVLLLILWLWDQFLVAAGEAFYNAQLRRARKAREAKEKENRNGVSPVG